MGGGGGGKKGEGGWGKEKKKGGGGGGGGRKKSGKWIRKAEITERGKDGSAVNLHDLEMTSGTG